MNVERLICRRCGCELYTGRGEVYAISILAVADPFPPVFSESDLARDIRSELQRLVAQLKNADAQEAQDQVFRRLTFCLCLACYRKWIDNPVGN